MSLSAAVFIGFFPKTTAPAPAWLGAPSVREICSVSECISAGPANWINHWKHNAFGFYHTEALAAEVIGPSSGQFDLYAYRLFPLRCLGQQIETISIDSPVNAVPEDFSFLGHDIVTKSGPDFFECSPLSCNKGAIKYEVNQFCLIGGQDEALKILQEISRDGSYEPGPYYLFEVYRKRNAG
jgi:hypothetical protein